MKDWLANHDNIVIQYSIQLLVWLGLFLTPISHLMGVILFLIISDLFFGIWASVWAKKEKFSSRAFRRTLGKIIIYQFSIIFAQVLEMFIWPGKPLIQGVMSFVAVVEGLSVLENLKTITKIDILSFILHKINLTPDSKKYLFKLKNKNRKSFKKK